MRRTGREYFSVPLLARERPEPFVGVVSPGAQAQQVDLQRNGGIGSGPAYTAHMPLIHIGRAREPDQVGVGKIREKAGLQYVPVIAESMDVFAEFTDIDALLSFAEGKTARGNEREGVVLKASDGVDDTHFKVVSNRYLLKQQD